MSKPTMTFQDLLDAKIAILGGEKPAIVAKKLGIDGRTLAKKLSLMDKAYSSNLPSLKLDKEIMQATIIHRLEPIREQLSEKSLEIIEKADTRVSAMIENGEMDDPVALADISEKYSKRLSRLTGMDVDPGAGSDAPKDISPRIVNIFARFIGPVRLEKIQAEVAKRKVVDSQTMPPAEDEAIEGEIV